VSDDLYSSLDIVRAIGVKNNEIEEAYIAKKRNAYRVLAGKPGGKRSLEKSGLRWEDNINPLKTKRICFI
jgi:hypothetical protein